MIDNKQKLNIFLKIAEKLNEIGSTPILYGSLGLYKILNSEKPTNDIDILIEDKYIISEWVKLIQLMLILGYELKDEDEHEFIKDGQSVAFAKQSDLLEMNNISPDSLLVSTNNNVKYRELSVNQYLTCYKTVYKDEYRRKKNNNADEDKIKLIEDFLNNEKIS